ncbi:tetratricopeptide repeat protein 25 [Eurytemora carolleeae]|uniref:tetratricopeptide repeat protein 25 n=1 Tax=Eurytemora carolleeae TaxID=1294199 RepID=UPI000C767C11|nr:tetratricopeptide repeat protein 25 [Eurytemora carolleeae]|eukprot:XP_023336252.1 tetratricopeptide repeat protein 25-like [Eurytemora affinis]
MMVKNELEERERKHKRETEKIQQVMYVDGQRNMAVVLGERDVKSDVKAKQRRDRRVISVAAEGETTDADLYQEQGEIELKNGGDVKKALFYLSRAVLLNDYDETALVARSTCMLKLGRYEEAIRDAKNAVKRTKHSILAMEALGKSMYTAGRFENAIVQFQRIQRIRKSKMITDWIERCEETIKAFLSAVQFEPQIVEMLWQETNQGQVDNAEEESLPTEKSDKKLKNNRKTKQETRAEVILMGKLKADMDFLGSLSDHPGLITQHIADPDLRTKNLSGGIVDQEIKGAAKEGLEFLKVRKTFWETSAPPARRGKLPPSELAKHPAVRFKDLIKPCAPPTHLEEIAYLLKNSNIDSQ